MKEADGSERRDGENEDPVCDALSTDFPERADGLTIWQNSENVLPGVG